MRGIKRPCELVAVVHFIEYKNDIKETTIITCSSNRPSIADAERMLAMMKKDYGDKLVSSKIIPDKDKE